MQPIICPVAGIQCFNNSACQPLVRRHTPIFQNHGQRYGGSCVHEQTRTRHDRNAKKPFLRCINFLDSCTDSGSTCSENADFFCNFVPRHLEQKRKKCVLFSSGRIISLQPIIISCKEVQMKIHKSFGKTRGNRSGTIGMSQTRQNKIVNALLQMKWTLLQHRHERKRHHSNDIQRTKGDMGHTKQQRLTTLVLFPQTAKRIERHP